MRATCIKDTWDNSAKVTAIGIGDFQGFFGLLGGNSPFFCRRHDSTMLSCQKIRSHSGRWDRMLFAQLAQLGFCFCFCFGLFAQLPRTHVRAVPTDTCWPNRATKHTFWLKTQQDPFSCPFSCLSLFSVPFSAQKKIKIKIKIKNFESLLCSFPSFSLSLSLPPPYSLAANGRTAIFF